MKISKDSRQAHILSALEDNPALRVNQLAQEFSVTTETIRRDLTALAQDGRINRTYGGAVRIGHRFEPILTDRLKLLVGERRMIARCAVGLHANGEALLLGGGATMLQFARILSKVQHRMVVITPALPVAQELASNPLIEVMLLPGFLDPHEHVVAGLETLRAIEKFRAPVAIIGASGLNEEGVSEAMPGIGEVYAAMLANADRSVILADHSKFEKRALILLSQWDNRLSLITDQDPGSELSAAMGRQGARIVIAPSVAP